MKILIIIPSIISLALWPFLTAQIARTFNRNFTVWFMLGLLLPFISLLILHCLPARNKKEIVGRRRNPHHLISKERNLKLKRSA